MRARRVHKRFCMTRMRQAKIIGSRSFNYQIVGGKAKSAGKASETFKLLGRTVGGWESSAAKNKLCLSLRPHSDIFKDTFQRLCAMPVAGPTGVRY